MAELFTFMDKTAINLGIAATVETTGIESATGKRQATRNGFCCEENRERWQQMRIRLRDEGKDFAVAQNHTLTDQ